MQLLRVCVLVPLVASSIETHAEQPPLLVERGAGLAVLAPGLTPDAWASMVAMAKALLGPADADFTWTEGIDATFSFEENGVATMLAAALRSSKASLLAAVLVHDNGMTVGVAQGGVLAMRVRDGQALGMVDLRPMRFGLGRGAWGMQLQTIRLPLGEALVIFPQSAMVTEGRDALAAATGGLATTAPVEGRLEVWRAATGKLSRIRRRALVSPRGTVVLLHVG